MEPASPAAFAEVFQIMTQLPKSLAGPFVDAYLKDATGPNLTDNGAKNVYFKLRRYLNTPQGAQRPSSHSVPSPKILFDGKTPIPYCGWLLELESCIVWLRILIFHSINIPQTDFI